MLRLLLFLFLLMPMAASAQGRSVFDGTTSNGAIMLRPGTPSPPPARAVMVYRGVTLGVVRIERATDGRWRARPESTVLVAMQPGEEVELQPAPAPLPLLLRRAHKFQGSSCPHCQPDKNAP